MRTQPAPDCSVAGARLYEPPQAPLPAPPTNASGGAPRMSGDGRESKSGFGGGDNFCERGESEGQVLPMFPLGAILFGRPTLVVIPAKAGIHGATDD